MVMSPTIQEKKDIVYEGGAISAIVKRYDKLNVPSSDMLDFNFLVKTPTHGIARVIAEMPDRSGLTLPFNPRNLGLEGIWGIAAYLPGKNQPPEWVMEFTPTNDPAYRLSIRVLGYTMEEETLSLYLGTKEQMKAFGDAMKYSGLATTTLPTFWKKSYGPEQLESILEINKIDGKIIGQKTKKDFINED